MNATRPIIKASNLNKSFNSLQVLKDVSVEVEVGKTVVLIGPSGSGKSTLLRCLNLLEPVDFGTILFDGREITNLGKQAYTARREIGTWDPRRSTEAASRDERTSR